MKDATAHLRKAPFLFLPTPGSLRTYLRQMNLLSCYGVITTQSGSVRRGVSSRLSSASEGVRPPPPPRCPVSSVHDSPLTYVTLPTTTTTPSWPIVLSVMTK